MSEENTLWKTSWRDRLNLSRDDYDYILITNANYEDRENLDNGDQNPYWVGSFFRVTASNSFRMWRYDTDKPDGSLVLRFEDGDQRVQKPGNQYFFNCVHFDVYQKQEVRDKNGKIIIQSKGDNAGNPYKAWRPVTNIRERKRLAKAGASDEVSFFRKKYLQVGPAHYENLLTIIDKAAERCTCSGKLETIGYKCSHCDHVLLDIDDCDLSQADVNRYGDAKKKCRNCGVVDYPTATLECDSCDEPTALRFDQVVAKVRKQGTGTATKIEVSEIIPLPAFCTADNEAVVEFTEDGDPVMEGDSFLLTEDLEYVAHAAFDFDTANAAPGDGEVSRFLHLQPGDVGYSDTHSDYPPRKPGGPSKSRRRFR